MKNRLRIIFILSLFYGIIFKRSVIMTMEEAKKIILGTGSYEDVKCGNTVSEQVMEVMHGTTLDLHIKNLLQNL